MLVGAAAVAALGLVVDLGCVAASTNVPREDEHLQGHTSNQHGGHCIAMPRPKQRTNEPRVPLVRALSPPLPLNQLSFGVFMGAGREALMVVASCLRPEQGRLLQGGQDATRA